MSHGCADKVLERGIFMQEMQALFTGCRTYRRFKQEPVPQALLHTLVNVARERSCARNENVLRYAVVSRPELVADMQSMLRWAAALPPEIGTPRTGEQPTAMIVILREKGAGPLSDLDVGIAADAMAITAWQQGVGSAIIASVNHPQVQALLQLPADWEIRLVLALGYPAHTSTLVAAQEGAPLDYYVDEARNYFVPKRPESQVIRYYE